MSAVSEFFRVALNLLHTFAEQCLFVCLCVCVCVCVCAACTEDPLYCVSTLGEKQYLGRRETVTAEFCFSVRFCQGCTSCSAYPQSCCWRWQPHSGKIYLSGIAMSSRDLCPKRYSPYLATGASLTRPRSSTRRWLTSCGLTASNYRVFEAMEVPI